MCLCGRARWTQLNYNNLCYLEFDRRLKSEYKHYSRQLRAVLLGAITVTQDLLAPSSSYSGAGTSNSFRGVRLPIPIFLASLLFLLWGVIWLKAEGKDYACSGILCLRSTFLHFYPIRAGETTASNSS